MVVKVWRPAPICKQHLSLATREGGGEWPTVLNTCANNSYVLQMIFFVRVTKVIVDS
jgi:hypothetical protein